MNWTDPIKHTNGDKMRPTFIWDLDGTLLDSYEAILAGIQETYNQFGLPFHREEIRAFILRYSVQELLERDAERYGLDMDELNQVRAASLREKNVAIQLMDGARDVLTWTAQQGIENFIFTHKGDNALRILEDLGLASYFKEVVTGDRGFARKPAPDALLYLIDKYDLAKERTYYIGDRLLDVEAARRAGVHSLNLQVAEGEGNQQIVSLFAIPGLFEG